MTESFVSVLLVGIGGAAGAVVRHSVGSVIESRNSVISVNLVGSFILGIVLGIPGASTVTVLVGVGFCGGFTTFSSFTVETVVTAESGEILPAIRFALTNLIGGVGALILGSVLISVTV